MNPSRPPYRTDPFEHVPLDLARQPPEVTPPTPPATTLDAEKVKISLTVPILVGLLTGAISGTAAWYSAKGDLTAAISKASAAEMKADRALEDGRGEHRRIDDKDKTQDMEIQKLDLELTHVRQNLTDIKAEQQASKAEILQAIKQVRRGN